MGIVVTGRVESVLGAISIETYAIERKGTSLSAKLMMAILSFPRNEKTDWRVHSYPSFLRHSNTVALK